MYVYVCDTQSNVNIFIIVAINLCQSIAVHTFIKYRKKVCLHICKYSRLTATPDKQPSTILRTLRYNLDACLPLRKILCHIQWIQSPGIILALSRIVLTFLDIVQQRKDLKMRPHSAHQPEQTLPLPPEACQKPLKYRYLHITDTQRWFQQCLL